MFQREFQRLEQLQANQPDQLKISTDELKTISEKNVVDQFLFLLKAEDEVKEVDQADFDKAYQSLLTQFPEDTPPTDEQIQMIQSDIKGQLRQETFFNNLFKDIHITEDMAEKEYKEKKEHFVVPPQVHCSHVVRHTQGEGVDPNQALKEIMDAQSDLNKGVSFDDVIKKYSDHNGQGGDVGTFARGQMIEQFEKVAFSMEPGQVSEVFQTDFGYHIALLHEKLEERSLSFEEVKIDLMTQMNNKERDQLVQALLEELKGKAEISKE